MSARQAIQRAVFGLLAAAAVAAPLFLAVWSIRTLEVPSATERLGYTLSEIRDEGQSVPRVYFARLPAELPRINSAKERKNLFIRIMLPLILRANDDIEADRNRLLILKRQLATGREMPARDRAWLADLAREYRAEDSDLDDLVLRVDVIPPSLALAQAAIESGWGTSRFAQQGNALYGQWTFSGKGIVPSGRDDGKSHKIKVFPALYQSVVEYARNLNSHVAYRDFRSIRAELGAQRIVARGIRLAETLASYSERGIHYVEELHIIIRSNRLLELDATGLEEPA